ncbi:hypothetical protein GCM10010466_28740 [Planomonospora alba]|uniref:Uncharacterized protein n=1 Tax=Planomonospora alba TaxID=161354 RepID=A0ABP6N4V0_9ACTN
MKRFIAGLACAAAAGMAVPTLASTAHAQAPADPLAALQSKLGAGRGVSFSDTLKTVSGKQRAVVITRKGVLQFDGSGVVASDHTDKVRIKSSDLEELVVAGQNSYHEGDKAFAKALDGMTKPERTIRVKDVSYVSGGMFGAFLPQGKTWVRYPVPINGVLDSLGGLQPQLVNAAEPGTLKALLAHAVKRPGGYSGKITFGELYKVSPWFRASMPLKPTGAQAELAVDWRLSVGSDGLPTRLTSSYSVAKGSSIAMETTYTGWGAKVSVKAPPADEVIDFKDLDLEASDVPVPLLAK